MNYEDRLKEMGPSDLVLEYEDQLMSLVDGSGATYENVRLTRRELVRRLKAAAMVMST